MRKASTGSVQYVPDKSSFVWKIKQLGGAREFLMRAHFGLPSVRAGKRGLPPQLKWVFSFRIGLEQEAEQRRAPITVKFEIPYFTVSGIQVRYLKIVEKSGYQALPWVRYITQNGDDYRSVATLSLDFIQNTHPFIQFTDSAREGQCADSADVIPPEAVIYRARRAGLPKSSIVASRVYCVEH